MIGRIVEISTDSRHLSMDRGFLVVSEKGDEVGRVPLDDIAAVVVNAHGVTHSSNLLAALAKRNVPFVLCGDNHTPIGMLWPVEGNFEQAGRMDAQIKARRPLRKRLWQQTVKAKLRNQAAVLEALGSPTVPITALIEKVRSGDPENVEAQAARRYWSLAFGEDFRRDRTGDGVNALLNYGYAVLRSATARAVIAAGMHPSIGLHHSNTQNAMRLVDDLMEPFRPFVDLRVVGLRERSRTAVDSGTKKALADLMYADFPTAAGLTPLMACLQKTAVSLAQAFAGEREDIEFPSAPSALELRALVDRE